jgi:hypothetical protein
LKRRIRLQDSFAKFAHEHAEVIVHRGSWNRLSKS